MSFLDAMGQYFPMNTPSYNQYSDEDDLMVQRAKMEAQRKAAQNPYSFQQGLDVGGFQPGQSQQMPNLMDRAQAPQSATQAILGQTPQSNQQDTQNFLRQQWGLANNAPQPQGRSYGPFDAVGEIARAIAMSQGKGGNSMQVSAPSILDTLTARGGY